MANDSTASGYITPEVAPLYDDALDDVLQAAVAGITGLPGPMVRPRLQREPASQPDASTDWAAVGYTNIQNDWQDYEGHVATSDGGLGVDRLQHDELISVLCSFYGPNSARNEMTLRTGLQIEQNRTMLQANGLEFVEQSSVVRIPALIKNAFVPRHDTTLTLRRRAEFIYAIRNIESASFETLTDVGVSSTTIVSN